MRNRRFPIGCLALLAGLCLALSVAPSAAAPTVTDCDPEYFDRDKDKYISRAEYSALVVFLEKAGPSACRGALLEKATELAPLIQKYGFLLVSQLKIERPKATPCNFGVAFYLRATGMDLNGLACNQPAAKPATTTYTYDFEAGISKVVLDGIFAVRLLEPRDSNIAGTSAYWTLLAFTEADGTYTTGSDPSGHTRFGLIGQMSFAGFMGLDSHVLEIAGFWHSDMKLTASAYGGKISWKPQSARWNLGGYIVDKENKYNYYYWLVEANLDVFHVDDPGFTMLAPDTDYAWLGADIGFRSSRKTGDFPNIIEISADANYAYDLKSGNDAYSLKAGINLYMDEEKHAAIGAEYSYGKSKKSLEMESKITAGLKLKF